MLDTDNADEYIEHSVSNILVVDDDPEVCRLLNLLFRRQGYETTAVQSGPEALEYVEGRKPDVVVLDVMMPEMDGWETYRRLSNTADVPPVLFLTAMTPGECAGRLLRIGTDDYLQKPFHVMELLFRIEALLMNGKAPNLRLQSDARGQLLSQRPSVSVVIPTLNEAKNLPLVLPYLPQDWIDEVILVDGRSTDGTVEKAQELMPSIKVLMEPRLGKGLALRAGYRESSGDIIIVMDADGSHDPREIPRFVAALMEGADFAKGSRFAPGGGTTDMPRLRQAGNKFFVLLVNLLFNVHFTDLCYGYHAFWRYCLDTLNLDDANGFEIDTAIYVRALHQRLRVTEVPSFEGYRFLGKGKLRTFPDGLRVLRTIFQETVHNLHAPSNSFHKGFRGHLPHDAHGRQVQIWKRVLTND